MQVANIDPLKIPKWQQKAVLENNNVSEESLFLNNSDKKEVCKKTAIEELKEEFERAKNEQGCVASVFDFFKNAFNTKYSQKNIEKFINNLNENSTKEEIEEAHRMIQTYASKQDSLVNTASTTVSSVAAGLFGAKLGAVIGTAIFPGAGTIVGGLLGIACGALIGAVAKVGINQLENCTDKVENNEWLQDEDFTKDLVTGAFAGGTTVLANNLTLKLADKFKKLFGLTNKGVAMTENGIAKVGQSALKNGLSEGFANGTASALESDVEYAVNCAVDSGKNFNFGELLETTAFSFSFGALLSGGFGAASGAKNAKNSNIARINRIKQRAIENPKVDASVIEELTDDSYRLTSKFDKHTNEATRQINDAFDGVDDAVVTGRAKSENSTFEKLISKQQNGKLKTTSVDDCFDAIRDAYGTRVCVRNLSQDEAQDILYRITKDANIECTYDDICRFFKGDLTTLSDDALNFLQSGGSTRILNELKEAQMQPVVDQLVKKIKTGEIVISELNNYGDEISTYFTKHQLEQIADAYHGVTGEKLLIITREDMDFGVWGYDPKSKGIRYFEGDNYILTNNNATKGSGYAAAQMNTTHTFKNGEMGYGELQIRGREVDLFAEAEHIPYDIGQGKIKMSDIQYAPITKNIKRLSKKGYNMYNKYLTDVYDALRLREMGLNVSIPNIDCRKFVTLTKRGVKKKLNMACLSYEALMRLRH